MRADFTYLFFGFVVVVVWVLSNKMVYFWARSQRKLMSNILSRAKDKENICYVWCTKTKVLVFEFQSSDIPITEVRRNHRQVLPYTNFMLTVSNLATYQVMLCPFGLITINLSLSFHFFFSLIVIPYPTLMIFTLLTQKWRIYTIPQPI